MNNEPTPDPFAPAPPPDQPPHPDTATQRVLGRLSARALGWLWTRLGGRKLDRL